MKLLSAAPTSVALSLVVLPHVTFGGNDETFTYKLNSNEDDEKYAPPDWKRVGCDDLNECAGWPDDWELGYDWGLENAENACRWCPVEGSSCGAHHQSPIDLKRDKAINDGTENFRQCIDWHWMKYEEGTCNAQDLRQADAYSIERHALKVTIPYEEYTGPGPGEDPLEEHYETGWQPTCTDDNGNFNHWPRIDFSKGFPDWWFLSHTDLKVPSEHTQEGKRYSAEVQMYHFYSKSRNAPPDENGDPQENEMAAISVFLEAYDDVAPYAHLDRMICEWRAVEERVREECGEDSVGEPYPGCFNAKRGYTPFPTGSPTKAPVAPTLEPTPPPAEPTEDPTREPTPEPTEEPVMEETDPPVEAPVAEPTDAPVFDATDPPVVDTTDPPVAQPVAVEVDPVPSPVEDPVPDPTEQPIQEFPVAVGPVAPATSAASDGEGSVRRQRRRLGEPTEDALTAGRAHRRRRLKEENFRKPDMTEDEWAEFIEATSAHDRGVATAHQRDLLSQDHLLFHNYQWMIDCKTEYYFRYQGTQTIPPCWGELLAGSRAQVNHWRIMKDPIRVHPRQIKEIERLLRERIDPKRCRKDTAAKVERDGTVSVARPLQSTAYQHFKVFCECFDFQGNGWSSKWPEDRTWCRSQNRDQLYRFYEHPYNYNSSGVF